MKEIHVGNAESDSQDTRGWFVGHFLDAATGVRKSNEVELKWGIHPKGDRRAQHVTNDPRTTILVLITGRFRLELEGRRYVLGARGDYVMWGSGLEHIWEAEEDSTVLTVRWPSIPM